MSDTNPTQDSALAVTLTVGELRALVREEIKTAMEQDGAIPKVQPDKTYLTIKEAADLSGLAPSTIRLLIRKRQLKALQVGRRVIIKRADLERFLEAHPIEATTA
jgi:excisionase family DNA binding protein